MQRERARAPRPDRKRPDRCVEGEARAIFARLPNRRTADEYCARLAELRASADMRPLSALMEDAARTVAAISTTRERHTRRNVLVAVAAAFKHAPRESPSYGAEFRAFRADAKKWQAARRAWQKHLLFATATITAELRRNKPTPKQEATYTSFDEIDRWYARAPKVAPTPREDLERLLISFYAHQVPKRADLGAVRVLRTPQEQAARADDHPNSIVLAGAAPRMIIRQHKTAAHFGAIDEPIDPRFARDALASLERYPRPYLFGHMTNAQFSHFVRTTFAKLFGRPTGPTMLRHAYIKERIPWATSSEAQLEDIARRMGHSSAQQRLYKWV